MNQKKKTDKQNLDSEKIPTHDPKESVETLRNHLASPDSTLAFLFGAGTSSSINIAPMPKLGVKREYKPLVPSITPLTKRCKAAVANMDSKYKAAWDLLEKQCVESKYQPNIENILSKLQSKIDAVGIDEKLLELKKDELINMEVHIRKTIAGAVKLQEKDITEYIPHKDFVLWLKGIDRSRPIEIFTTNYDILFEREFELANMPFFDGFVGGYEPFFYPESLEHDELLPPNHWIRLWKIHGSITWKRLSRSSKERVVRLQQMDSGEMIFPSQRKYVESKKQPYTALMDRLKRMLNQERSLLITCGYSFNDEHINSIILGVLEHRSTANVISLQFREIYYDSKIVGIAKQKKNLIVLAKNAGVIGGEMVNWKLLRAVDEKTCSYMDVAFDSNADVETDGNAGDFRLGDFNWFCKFLTTMGRIG